MSRWRRLTAALLTDVRPLQQSADYRRLFFGNAVAQLGQQMTAITIAIQVYELTGNSFSVGLVGVFALVPLVAVGLYAGALADSIDRRALSLWSSALAWAASIGLMAQAFVHNPSVWVLYLLVSVQSVAFALTSPARNAMIARLLPAELMPAASALNMATFNIGFTLGPMLGALAVAHGGYALAYGIDVLTFTAALYALVRLPSMPPDGTQRRTGWRSVVDGLRYLHAAKNLRMTFIADLFAMVLAQPRALFPALAAKVYGGGAATVGLLQSAPAVGSLIAFAVSGWISRVRLQGVAIIVSVAAYGLAVGAVGLTDLLWLAAVFLALSGAADMISAAYRSTILQVAAPDHLRGRLQGVFIVVVAGGPRAGDFLIGTAGDLIGERWALLAGGLACAVGVLIVALLQRSFLRYDANAPQAG